METERTQPDQSTRQFEQKDAKTAPSADRQPTADESTAAESAQVADPGDVAEHYEEMAERGANQKGEGRITP